MLLPESFVIHTLKIHGLCIDWGSEAVLENLFKSFSSWKAVMPSCHTRCSRNNMDRMIILVPLDPACHPDDKNMHVWNMQAA